MSILAAQQAKAIKSLETKMRYSEGIMSKKEWIELQIEKGSRVEQGTKNRLRYNRIKYNRLRGGLYSNEQEEYEKKCNELITCYRLYPSKGTSSWEITKSEYNYFNSLIKQP